MFFIKKKNSQTKLSFTSLLHYKNILLNINFIHSTQSTGQMKVLSLCWQNLTKQTPHSGTFSQGWPKRKVKGLIYKLCTNQATRSSKCNQGKTYQSRAANMRKIHWQSLRYKGSVDVPHKFWRGLKDAVLNNEVSHQNNDGAGQLFHLVLSQGSPNSIIVAPTSPRQRKNYMKILQSHNDLK